MPIDFTKLRNDLGIGAAQPSPQRETLHIQQIDVRVQPSSRFLEIALPLAERGFKVTPLEGKRPFLPDWKHTASSDTRQIRDWAAKYPNSNAGIVTSEQSWSLDVDHMDWFMQNAPWPLPETLVVETGSGKFHLHFKGVRPAGLKMVKNPAHVSKEATPKEPVKLLEYPDQVVAPGSIHPETGRPYTISQDKPLSECPPAWLQWLQSLNEKRQAANNATKLIIRKDWNPEIELTKAGLKYTIRKEGDKTFLDYHAAMGKCLVKGEPHHSNGHVDGPTQSRFLIRKLENGWDLAHQCFSCGGATTKEALAAIGIDLNDIVVRNHEYRIEFTGHTLENVKAQKVEWLVEGRLAKGVLVYMFAPKGRGKTKLCNYWNKLVNDLGLRVVRLNMEDSEDKILKPSLHAAGFNIKLTECIDKAVNAHKGDKTMKTAVDFSQEAHIVGLREYLRKFGDVGLVIIEPINNYKGKAKSVSEDEMRPIYQNLANLAEELNICILALNHTNKKKDVDAQEKSHGASSAINVARINWFLEKDFSGEKETDRILTDAGSNIPVASSLAFKIAQVPAFTLDGTLFNKIAIATDFEDSDITADEAAEAGESLARRFKSDAIAEWLVEHLLGKGPINSDRVVKEGHQANNEWSTDNIRRVFSRRMKKVGGSLTKKGKETLWEIGNKQASFAGE